MTINDIRNLPDNSWINEPFTAQVTEAMPKSGKSGTFWKLKLANPDFPSVKISATVFGHDGAALLGKVVNFQGQGMKKDSYNNHPQLTIGDKASVTVVGEGKPVPAPTFTPKPSGGFKKSFSGGSSSGPNYGMTVGCATHAISRIVAAGGIPLEKMPKAIERLTLSLIEIEKRISGGEVAAPTPPATQPDLGIPAEESTLASQIEAEQDEEDDVPF